VKGTRTVGRSDGERTYEATLHRGRGITAFSENSVAMSSTCLTMGAIMEFLRGKPKKNRVMWSEIVQRGKDPCTASLGDGKRPSRLSDQRSTCRH